MRCSQKTASRWWLGASCMALWTWWLWLGRRWTWRYLSLTHTSETVISVCTFCWVLNAPLQIDLHIMTQPPSGEWVYFSTEVTNSSGRVSFVIPEDKRLGIGVYPVKMVVRWDYLDILVEIFLSVNATLLMCRDHIHSRSAVDWVVLLARCSPGVTTPLQTATWLWFHEAPSLWCLVLMDLLLPACQSWAVTPKCGLELWTWSGSRTSFPGMVVVGWLDNLVYVCVCFSCSCPFRHWQDLGYLIIYVTGRPDMQKQRVVAWLSQHNFPHGIVSFCDGLVHDPLRHKANFLKSLTEVRLWWKDRIWCTVQISFAYSNPN